MTIKHMHKWILILLLGIHVGTFGQNVRRGFKLLEKLDYERSEEIFQDAYSSDESVPAACFGLAMIHADDQSPYYDLVQAWSYVNILEPNLDALSQDEIEFIGEYFVNTESRRSSRPVKTKIEYAIATIEAKLIKYVREENNLELVYEVIDKFPDFRHYGNVIHIRNQLEFRKYEKQHTMEGYLEFIKRFPDAAQIEKAKRYISSLAFEKARQTNSVEAYRKYIHDYPESPEYNTAVRNLHAVAFQQTKEINTMQAMEDFMAEYPDALEVAEAKQIQRQLLYDYAKKIQTLEAYNEFIRKYPEGQQYIDIFNLKSLDLGMKYISSNSFPSNNIQWTRSFEEEDYLGLNACIVSTDAENTYVIGGTIENAKIEHTDIWLIKTNDEGKMLWSKSIGEKPNQDLRLLTTGQDGEIIGFGYIWIGSDSLTYQPWIFKLASNGEKLWNKTLENLNAQAMITLESGQIVLGGYVLSDSLERSFSLMMLSPAGKKLWTRNYSVPGEIQSLHQLNHNHMLLVGNHWSAEIDDKGYIIWESSVRSDQNITDAAILPSGDIIYAGLHGNKQLFIKTDKNNNRVFEKEYDVSGGLKSITHLLPGTNNMIAGICHYDNNTAIQWMNGLNGTIERTVELPGSFRISGMITDQQNNLLLIAGQEQILLVKNFGFAF